MSALFDMFDYAYVRNAYVVGTCIAIMAAVIGYFLLVRGLTFAGHALSHMGFAGAAGAVLVGINPLYGLLAFAVGAGVGIGLSGQRLRDRDIAIGIAMTLTLGLGLLFMTLHRGSAERIYSFLFGSILGISATDVQVTLGFSIGALLVMLIVARPLLFSSFDPSVAEARGVPVRLLAVVFMILLGISVAVATQIVGVLLIFTLLVGPAATAMRLVHHPVTTMLVAIALGLSYTWIGIALAEITTWPVTFFIASLSFAFYFPVRLFVPQGRYKRMASVQKSYERDRSVYHTSLPVSLLHAEPVHQGVKDA